MDTQFHAVPALASRRSLENDLDRLLDAATEATAIFRAAVEAYLTAGSESACWSLAQRISTQMCTVDELQQRPTMHPDEEGIVGLFDLPFD